VASARRRMHDREPAPPAAALETADAPVHRRRRGRARRRWPARLNGWHRLWLAVALLSLVPAASVIVSDWETGDAWLRERQSAAPTRVHVDGAGDVDFPATMSPEAIAIVTRAGNGSSAAIEAGIRAWNADLRRLLDAQAAVLDRLLVIRVLEIWAASVVGLYILGWLAAWVWRGF
jgi:hypothetical protein